MSFLIMSNRRIWRSNAANNKPDEIHSPFIQDYIERRDRQRDFRSWTSDRGENGHPSMWSKNLTWGNRGRPIPEVHVQFQDAAPDGEGGYYFTVNFGVVGGLFHHNAQGEERRLFHRERFRCDGLAYQPAGKRFAAAFGAEDGTTHICLLDENGREVRWLTEGDSNDAFPAWDPSRPGTILYQASGLAHRPEGWAEYGAWEAMELNLEKGELSTLWRRDGMDVLLPRRDARGNLYALIRPSGDAPVPWWETARRVALVPWVFVQGVFGFANAFTSMFAQKPLWRAGGPPGKVDSAPAIRVLGKRLETRVLEENGKVPVERRYLAPASWQLWRRDLEGVESMVADHVSWFALSPDGTPYYTTGLAIHALKNEEIEIVYRGSLIESFMPLL